MDSELIPPIEVDPVLVTPGVVGFIFTFLVMVAALLLILDMARRVRRVRYREEIREKLDREEAGDGPDATAVDSAR